MPSPLTKRAVLFLLPFVKMNNRQSLPDVPCHPWEVEHVLVKQYGLTMASLAQEAHH